MKFRVPDSLNMSCTVNGEDFDEVIVNFELSPPEPDVNFQGGVELISVIDPMQKDQLDNMSEEDQQELAVDILEYLNDWAQGYDEELAERRYARD
jgi:hypothetical protein